MEFEPLSTDSVSMGQICKFLDHECVASVPTWNLPKHACMTVWNPVLMHGWNYMPRVGIQ